MMLARVVKPEVNPEVISSLHFARPLPLALRAAYERQRALAARRTRWLEVWRRTMARDAFVFGIALGALIIALVLDRCHR